MPELTIAAAIIAGLVSFLSPCVLPVVPAYLGQLGAIAVSDRAVALQAAMATSAGPMAMPVPSPTGARPVTDAARRRQVLPHALLFVLGFGGVFTVLGTAAQYAFQGLTPDQLDIVRFVGGAILVVLGLNLAGVFRSTALMLDRAPVITRPLVRHGRLIEIVGGALVVIIGLAVMFDWLTFIAARFSFLNPSI